MDGWHAGGPQIGWAASDAPLGYSWRPGWAARGSELGAADRIGWRWGVSTRIGAEDPQRGSGHKGRGPNVRAGGPNRVAQA